MPCGNFRYLFGPVASRRFGRSLGVDLLGQRICSFDCTFCEAGPTQKCTMERAVYVPTDVVVAELRAWLGSGGMADVITLAGRGEPTLHQQFGVVIDAIHRMCEIPVVLLSNGSLLGLPEVRRDAARADIVKISLSGWDDASIAAVNRPAPGIGFDGYISGMIAFRKAFQGELRLEIMFVNGLNTDEDRVAQLAHYARRIGADKIELNTVVRPPSDHQAGAVPVEVLQRYAAIFGPTVVVLGRQAEALSPAGLAGQPGALSEKLLALLGRRGCTLDELAVGLGVERAALEAILAQLRESGLVKPAEDREGYYQLAAKCGITQNAVEKK